MEYTRRLLIVFALFTIFIPTAAQKENVIPPEATKQIDEPMTVDRERHVDTLSVKDRLSLRTNSADWLMLIPNIGMEFDLKNTNYSRNAIGLNLRYNWQTSHTYNPGLVYNLAEVRLDFRNYFRVKEIDTGSEWTRNPHKHIWDKVFSARHKRSKNPNAVFYRGAYLAYTKYSLMLGKEGRQGSAIGAGYQFGMVKPLYVFRNGHSLDLDLGVALGIVYTSYDKYRLDRNSNCYPKTGKVDGQILPMLNELRCALVYRLGKTAGTKKYRWRYDVDMAYQTKMDSIHDKYVQHKTDLHYTDSIQSLIRKDFYHVYDSLLKIKRAEQDTIKLMNVKKKKAEIEQKKAEKEAEKKKKKEAAAGMAAGVPQGEATITGDSANAEGTPSESESKEAETAPEGNTAPESAQPEANAAPEANEENGEMKEDKAKEKEQTEAPEEESTEQAPEEDKNNGGQQEAAASAEAADNANGESGEDRKEDGQ